MKAIKQLASIFVAAATTQLVLAVEVAPEQAQTAVRNWIVRNPCPMTARFARSDGAARTFAKDGRVLFHVVQLEGGGFVVTSGDTKVSPIVAFSADGTFSPDGGNPLAALLKKDMAARLEALDNEAAPSIRKRLAAAAPASAVATSSSSSSLVNEQAWDELLSEEGVPPKSAGVRLMSVASPSQLSDVRVEPLLKTEWDQSTWGGGKTSVATYNLYTPNNYVCGCVATAGAQIMKFWEYPKGEVAAQQSQCFISDETAILKMRGGAYAWSSMPLKYADAKNITDAQRQAIGKLAYDVGVVSHMNYTRAVSLSMGCFLGDALREVFGYKSATTFYPQVSIGKGVDEVCRNAILASLDAGMPAFMGVNGGSTGHEIVADGYGFNGKTLYVHLNCGWSGADDLWYAIFNENLTSHKYSVIQEVGFNIHPEKAGDVISGRVLDSAGRPVSGAAVTLSSSNGSANTMSNAKGIYYFRATSAGSYSIKAVSGARESKSSIVNLEKTSVSAVATAIYPRSASFSTFGSCSNKWGNDLVLESPDDVEPELEQVASPVFTPAAGNFTSASLAVTLTCGTSGAVVYYTKDGTVPTASSTRYTGPVTISAATTFKAIAIKSGMRDSEVVVKKYTKQAAATISAAQGMDWNGTVSISDASYVGGQSAISHDGEDAAQLKAAKSTVTATITVYGPGTLTYWWAADEFSIFDKFDLYVDGAKKLSKDGVAWSKVTYPLPSGTHSIQWSLASSMSAFITPTAKGFVDEVSFVSHPGGTCKVLFDSNGADGGTPEKTSMMPAFADEIVVPGAGTLYREGYAFLGWAASPDAVKAQYLAGKTMAVGEQETRLYAVWKPCITLIAEIPQSGGSARIPFDTCYGSSYLMKPDLPSWASSFKVMVGDSSISPGAGGWKELNILDADSAITVVFSAEANDSPEDRSFDVDLDAQTYQYVIRCHVVQKADVKSSKPKLLSIEKEGGLDFSAGTVVASSDSVGFVAKIVRRNSSADAVDADWQIVRGEEYASVSANGVVTASEVSSPQTATLRATYYEDGIAFAQDRTLEIVPPSHDEEQRLSISGVGWHLVSFSVLPEDSSPENVFGAELVKVGSLADMGSLLWTPSYATLTKLKTGEPYWINTTQANLAVSVAGTPDPGREYNLKKGYNRIGFSLNEPGATATVLRTALDSGAVSYVADDGSLFYPGGGLETMSPGKVYWVYAPEACTIRYDFE